MTRISLVLAAGILLLQSATASAQCVPTVSRTPGTHYEPVTQNKIHVGKGLTVSGFVRAAGDCKPIVGAKVAHWQANSKGKYTDEMRAYLLTGKKGRYSFKTEWPGAKIPHIHFMVIAEGYKTLITQWVGDRKRGRIEFNIILEPSN